jgi:hypothetical protein
MLAKLWRMSSPTLVVQLNAVRAQHCNRNKPCLGLNVFAFVATYIGLAVTMLSGIIVFAVPVGLIVQRAVLRSEKTSGRLKSAVRSGVYAAWFMFFGLMVGAVCAQLWP